MNRSLIPPGRLLPALAAALGLAILPANAPAVDATNVADASVNAAKKLGFKKTLDVADGQKVVIQFELDTLPDDLTANDIRKATLRLWVGKIGEPGSLKVRSAGNGATLIDEADITAANAPAAGAEIASLVVTAPDALSFVTVDVTSYLKGLPPTAASLPAFIIEQSIAGDGTKVSFDSKESPTTSHGPQLQVALAGGGGGGGTAYGDGSSGAMTITATNVIIDQLNAQFTDLTINAGATVFAISGTVIRCTGTFTNNGSITAVGSAKGGVAGTASTFSGSAPHPGLASSAPGNGFATDTAQQLFGGIEGQGVGQFGAKSLLNPGFFGGGGGGGGSNRGGTGGASFVVRAAGALTNGGMIFANGSSSVSAGDGGGGGGIVVLASKTSVTQSGTVESKGGAGANGDASNGGGGGGGGGVIHLFAPTVANTGTSSVLGGAGGTGAQVTTPSRVSGGGGGACAGNGGVGGQISAGASVAGGGGDPGEAGQLVITQRDPTALLE